MAPNLHEARQEAARHLDEQVARAVREPERDKRRLVDRREIRGLAGRRPGYLWGDRWQLAGFRRTAPPARWLAGLALDQQGRTIVVVTTPSLWLRVGERFLVLDWLELFEPRGRPSTARERESTRAPHDSTSAKRQRVQLVEVPDDELDDAAAVAAAYAEQRRTPPDLANVAA